MSQFIDTCFGLFRKVSGDRWLWRCPRCGAYGCMSDLQMEGKVSVICSGPNANGCDYHETHAFGEALDAAKNVRDKAIIKDDWDHQSSRYQP